MSKTQRWLTRFYLTVISPHFSHSISFSWSETTKFPGKFPKLNVYEFHKLHYCQEQQNVSIQIPSSSRLRYRKLLKLLTLPAGVYLPFSKTDLIIGLSPWLYGLVVCTDETLCIQKGFSSTAAERDVSYVIGQWMKFWTTGRAYHCWSCTLQQLHIRRWFHWGSRGKTLWESQHRRRDHHINVFQCVNNVSKPLEACFGWLGRIRCRGLREREVADSLVTLSWFKEQ